MKTLKLLGTSALVAALAAPAFASGPDGDSFTVTFNGRAELSLVYASVEVDDGVDDDTFTGVDADGVYMENNYTRFGFTASGDTAVGAFKARIEGDFAPSAGNTHTFRLRHGYGQVGPILAGMTDSLMRTGTPYVSDWGWEWADSVSAGNNWGRVRQLRYTTEMGGAKVAVALEDAAPVGAGVTDFFDLTANAQFSAGPASVVVAGTLRDNGDSAVVGAASFSLGAADAFVTAAYGDGAIANFFVQAAGTTNFGIGGGVYVPAGDNLTAYVGASTAENQDNDDTATYATASLTWSPAPQYSIIGQVHYHDVDRPSTAAADDFEAIVFENRWMYKF